MHDVHDLKVNHIARDLASRVYDITSLFPDEEKFGLSSQMKRASISVFSNMAEGCGRRTDKDLLHFLYNANGSLKELEVQLEFAASRSFIAKAAFTNTHEQLKELARALFGLIKHYEHRVQR